MEVITRMHTFVFGLQCTHSAVQRAKTPDYISGKLAGTLKCSVLFAASLQTDEVTAVL